MDKEKFDMIRYNHPVDEFVERAVTAVEELSKKYSVDMARMRKAVDDLSTGEELRRLRSALADAREMMSLGFPVTKEERAAIDAWRKDGRENHQFRYVFTPTPIGVAGAVEDTVTGETLDFTDYTRW